VKPKLEALDIRWLVLYTSYPSMAHPNLSRRLTQCFGPPVEQRVDTWLWNLAGAPSGACPPAP
jgi:hypothetical protein